MAARLMDVDDLIHVYLTGMNADDLRNMVAAQGYSSVMSEMVRTQGIFSQGGKGSHDAMMIDIAFRMPSRYANSIIDDVKIGFSELRSANPLRYLVVIINHTEGERNRAHKAKILDLAETKFKNELKFGHEYLKTRFHQYLRQSCTA